MRYYLETVANHLEVMKKAGCSKEELIEYTNSLGVPLIQANLEAMIVSRTAGYVPGRSKSRKVVGSNINQADTIESDEPDNSK